MAHFKNNNIVRAKINRSRRAKGAGMPALIDGDKALKAVLPKVFIRSLRPRLMTSSCPTQAPPVLTMMSATLA
jgi:hypothetical protein